MSYFDKANRSATRRSYGSTFGKEITRKDLIPVKDRGNRKALTESSQFGLKEDLEKKVSDTRFNAYKDEQNKRHVLNEGYKTLKDDLIKDVMRQICVESLVVDEEPVMENLKNIFEIVDEQVESIGGFEGIKQIAITTKNPVLNEMTDICETMAKKVADRVLQEEVDCFKMKDDEVEEFDYNKKQMGVDTIVDVVKDKVLNVVKDEQKISQEKEEMITEIKDKLEDVEAPVEEAMEFIFGQDKVEEVSLFSSMMRKNYKSILETSAATIFEANCAKDKKKAVCEDDEIDINDIDVHEDEDYLDKNLMKASDMRLTDVDKDIDGEIDEDPSTLNDLINDNEDDDEVEELMIKEGFAETFESLGEQMGEQLKKIKKNPEKGKKAINKWKNILDTLRKIKDQKKQGDFSYDKTDKIEKESSKASVQELDEQIKIIEKNIKAAEKQIGKLETKAAKKEASKEAVNPLINKFIEIGEDIMESYMNDEIETYEKLLNEMATFIEGFAPGCKGVENAKACKELVRNIEVSTEELELKKKEVAKIEGEDGEVVMELDEKKPQEKMKPTEADKRNVPEPTTEGARLDRFNEKLKAYNEKQSAKLIAKRDFTAIRSNLTNFVKQAKTEADIDYLIADDGLDIQELERAKLRYPDGADKINEHIKWLKTDYKKMIEKRRKEIKAEGVTEAFSARVDAVCDRLDEEITAHEDALYEANMSLESEYEGKTIILPLIESIDVNLSNIKFVYKVKTVCESLSDMIDEIENETDAVQLQEMVQINMASIDSTKNMISGNEEISDYKVDLLEHARIQLSNMNSRINSIKDGLEDRIDYESINEAKTLIDELYDTKRNETLLEHVNNGRMELVMAETITNYTVLEAFHTLNLLKFDKESVRQIARANIK